ncbi:HNH endonuclease signature motif containing protein [Pseudonocardia sp.]|uniref:HNH endonuclease signature motif containing protein n=1 Tax=Pseudonocardia sp. TaxID=60912 RepID=UPI0026343054|nr:HNH endonuclease signature motif containing protein [Pseudonocardia sp.]
MQAVAQLPDDLAAMPPGPELAAVLGAVDLSVVPNDRMLEVLTAQHRQLCHDQARMAATLAELGRCTGGTQPGQVARLAALDRYAPDETRAALRWTRTAAEFEHDLADTVVHTMPALFTAWLDGALDRPRVLVFHRYLTDLAAEQITAICRTAVPRAPRLTTGQLAVLLRRMVLAVDPAAAERWYRKGVRERNVVAVMDPDGTVTLSGNGLPADEAEAACGRLQDLADAAKRAGHPGLIGQIRCDLYLGMLDGRFHGMDTDRLITTLITQYRPDGPGTATAARTAATSTATGAPSTDPSLADATVVPAAPSGPAAPATGRTPTGPATIGPAAAGPAAAGPAAAGPAAAGPAAAGPAAAGPAAAGPAAAGSPTGGSPAAGPPTTASPTAGSATAGSPAAHPGDNPTAGPTAAPTGIEIRVALSTLLGHDEHPGEIPGLGLLTAPATRARVAQQRRAQWRFAVTDTTGRLLSEGLTRRRPGSVGDHPVRRDGPAGGIVEIHVPATLLHQLQSDGVGEWAGVVADIAARHARRDDHLADLDAHPARRFPTAALRRHTEIRDRTCTFPGCRRRAHTSHTDHTRDHARGGATIAANTGPACGHDHDVKHRGGWQLHQPEPGRFVWRSPLGGQYRTGGGFLLPELPEAHPVDLGPHFDQPTRRAEGPILQPLRRVEPPRPPPRADLPDEPPF